jgi:hypothetical protein
MLEALLPALVAVRAQALQLASPELGLVAAMWLDVVSDTSRNEAALA